MTPVRSSCVAHAHVRCTIGWELNIYYLTNHLFYSTPPSLLFVCFLYLVSAQNFFAFWACDILQHMQPSEENQSTLFDLTGKEFNAYWVDEKAPLFIPNNPLHWKAHKLQALLSRLEIQAQKNPAQFNSKNYIDVLNELERLMTQITERPDDELDEGAVASIGDEGAAPTMGEGVATSVGVGVSTNNPLSR